MRKPLIFGWVEDISEEESPENFEVFSPDLEPPRQEAERKMERPAERTRRPAAGGGADEPDPADQGETDTDDIDDELLNFVCAICGGNPVPARHDVCDSCKEAYGWNDGGLCATCQEQESRNQNADNEYSAVAGIMSSGSETETF